MQIGIRVLLVVSILSPCWIVVHWLSPASSFHVLPLDPSACLYLLGFAAIWMLTAPEPGPRRMDSPRTSSGWARWLNIACYVVMVVRNFLPLWITQIRLSSSSAYPLAFWMASLVRLAEMVAVVCLLVMLRQYAMRISDAKAAKSLEWAAILGGLVAVGSLIGALLYAIASPSWMGFTVYPMLLLDIVYGGSMIWAVLRFARGLRCIVQRRGFPTKVGKTAVYLLVAIGVGGFVGYLVGEALFVQARDFGMMVMLMASMWWGVGAIIGLVVLPNRLALLHRRLVRSR